MGARTRIRVRWADGSVTEAASWEDLEASLRRLALREYRTARGFRRALAHRCAVWTGQRVKVGGTSEDFLLGLAGAGLFDVEAPPRLRLVRGR